MRIKRKNNTWAKECKLVGRSTSMNVILSKAKDQVDRALVSPLLCCYSMPLISPGGFQAFLVSQRLHPSLILANKYSDIMCKTWLISPRIGYNMLIQHPSPRENKTAQLLFILTF